MNHRKLAAVGAHLEESVKTFPNETDALRQYFVYERIAIAILDSEFATLPNGVLEAYLQGYLTAKRHELGITESQLD